MDIRSLLQDPTRKASVNNTKATHDTTKIAPNYGPYPESLEVNDPTSGPWTKNRSVCTSSRLMPDLDAGSQPLQASNYKRIKLDYVLCQAPKSMEESDSTHKSSDPPSSELPFDHLLSGTLDGFNGISRIDASNTCNLIDRSPESSNSHHLASPSTSSETFSRASSISYPTSISNASSPPSDAISITYIKSLNDLFDMLRQNSSENTEIANVRFVDPELPEDDNDNTENRQLMIQQIHDRYVEPLLEITGYKWVRREVPSKGRGLKVFSIKYKCSQNVTRPRPKAGRSRQLSQPLKEFSCDSNFVIRYTWSTREIDIIYKHRCHSPYKRLPEKIKPFILQRLDKRAMDVYKEIMADESFDDIRDSIHFSKLQSYWSKMRIKRKEDLTKEAFKSFLNK